MIPNNNLRVLIFFVIFLVISVTPASAVLISETNTKEGADTEVLYNTINNDINNLKSGTGSLNNDVDYIKSRARDISWKFWKWPGIISDVVGAGYNILATSNKLKCPSYNLNNNINKLLDKAGNVQSDEGLYDLNNANEMADYLIMKYGVNFTLKNVSISDIKKGDVIQYLSQDKYPRYLEVVDVINQTPDGKQVSRSIEPIIIVKGKGDNIFKVPYHDFLGIFTDSNLNNEEIVKTAADHQQNNLNIDKDDLKTMKKSSDTQIPLGWFFVGVAGLCWTLGLALGIISFGTSVIIAGIISVGPASIGGILLYYGYSNIDKFNSLFFEVNAEQDDLNKYIQEGQCPNTNMYVDTFNGIPIIKHPPIGNWKEFIPIHLNGPEHGIVKYGPGLQFLYGPKEGYEGPDEFTFLYVEKNSKEGEIIGQINIKININPIPILPTTGGK